VRASRNPDLVALAVYSVLVCVWTWPLVTGATPLPARNFDAFCVQWVAAAATRLDLTMTDPLSQWPFGNSLARSDSLIYLLVARLLTPLLGVDGLVNSLGLVGQVVSAWAAERLARQVYAVPSPWSLVAGLAYAFTGLGATMVLEGHVYLLLAPWLPLLVGALQGLDLNRDARAGLVVLAWWTLCLLTSAYTGIAASLVVAVWGMHAVWSGRVWTAAWGSFTLGALFVGGLYTAVFVAAPDDPLGLDLGNRAAGSQMLHGSARLGLLVGWSPAVDLDGHSFWPSLAVGALALALYARWAPAAPGRVLAATAAALLLALGPQIDAYRPDDVGFPWLLSPFAEVAGNFFRFPSRLLPVASLGLGIVAAGVLAHLAERLPRAATVYGGALLVEAAVAGGLPFRTRAFEGSLPAAYHAAPAGWAVLDLTPVFAGPGEVDLAFYFDRLGCRWQALHGRPTLAQCVDTRPYAGVAHAVSMEVGSRLLEERTGDLADALRAVGIGSVGVRPDLYPRQDREQIVSGLEAALGPVAAVSSNGGEALALWTVPGAEGEPPPQPGRVSALASLLEGR